MSIVILNWDGKQFLDDCLGSFLSQTFHSFELILVDNGSTDDSVEYVRSRYPWVRIIETGKNLGFSRGNNVGIKASRGSFVIILNNDTKVSSDFIERLVGIALSDDSIGSVGCKILQIDGTVSYGPIFFSRCGDIIGVTDVHVFRSCREVDAPVECLANCGCAVLYRTSVLDDVGLYDEDFWSDWEDHDLGYRIALAGYRNLYLPRALVRHAGGGSYGWPHSTDRLIRIARNTLLTYFKNYEARNILLRFLPNLVFIIPVEQGIHVLLNETAILLRLNGKTHERMRLRRSYAVWVRSYIEFFRTLPVFIVKRARIQELRKCPDSQIMEATRQNNRSAVANTRSNDLHSLPEAYVQ